MSTPVDECRVEPSFNSLDEACFTMTLHSSHPASCIPFLAASAYVSGQADDFE